MNKLPAKISNVVCDNVVYDLSADDLKALKLKMRAIRPVNKMHMKEIYDGFFETAAMMAPVEINSISFSDDGGLDVVDGQHRISAFIEAAAHGYKGLLPVIFKKIMSLEELLQIALDKNNCSKKHKRSDLVMHWASRNEDLKYVCEFASGKKHISSGAIPKRYAEVFFWGSYLKKKQLANGDIPKLNDEDKAFGEQCYNDVSSIMEKYFPALLTGTWYESFVVAWREFRKKNSSRIDKVGVLNIGNSLWKKVAYLDKAKAGDYDVMLERALKRAEKKASN